VATAYAAEKSDFTSKIMSRNLFEEVKIASKIIPFKTTRYIVEKLIDWSTVPDDPVFQKNFPLKNMVSKDHFALIKTAVSNNRGGKEISRLQQTIYCDLLCGPVTNMSKFVYTTNTKITPGLVHIYPKIISLFPAPAQGCFAYCNYCNRWMKHIRSPREHSYEDPMYPVEYMAKHPEIKDVLFTGGDPLTMHSSTLRKYLDPILELKHLSTIRLSTSALAYWPYRFTSDDDADELIALLRYIIDWGKHLALMIHVDHPKELSTDIAEEAITRIQSTGAVIRCQNPILRHVNDSVETWVQLWERQLHLGLIPYYMFLESSGEFTDYFKIPIAHALNIFQEAQRRVSGLAKTITGPVFNRMTGKVHIAGTSEINGEKVFVLKVIHSLNPDSIGKIFFAKYDTTATRFEHLKPAFDDKPFGF
jgi:KamA family protein